MDTEIKPCMVCSAPNNSIHFGLEVCRACSSFFKRATLSGKQFPCRRMSRNCDVTRNDMLTCRGCRYDKCIAVGMVYDGPMRCRKNEDKTQQVGPVQDVCPDVPSTSTNSLLDRIGREYVVNVSNRQERELAMLRTCSNAKRLPHPTYEIYLGSADLVMLTMNYTIDETWIFMHKILPSLSEVPFREQMDLFRFYLMKFTMIDSYLRAWKVWGAFDKFSMCSVALCMDLEAPETWLREGEGGCNRNSVVETSMVYVREQMSVLVPSLKNAQLTDGEAHALFALMLCETDMSLDVSERLIALLEQFRAETLQDLQRYYRQEMKLSDFSTRLGNLMTICHNVRECSSHFQSFFRMQVTLFDIWSADIQLKQLLF